MNRAIRASLAALIAVAAIAWLATVLPEIGIASAALLFLLPVTYAAVRGGTTAGLISALTGAAAYNFFLLPPRHTFRIHGFDNFVSVLVFVLVALVTSRLAAMLKAREAEALARATASEERATLSTLLAANKPSDGLEDAMRWLAGHYARALIIHEDGLPEKDAGFSALDLAAAAWALHNGDMTGHGTMTMPAAEWSFLPMGPKQLGHGRTVAIARPASGITRSPAELEHLSDLAVLLGQACDRVELEAQTHERERLAQAERLRRTFLASLAHDFRTPLTIVTARLTALSAHVADAHDALEAAHRLQRMLDDLLGAARIEDGSVTPGFESVDLVDVVGAAVEGLPWPGTIILHRAIPADLAFVRADPVLLKHILVNLLDNAARHARTFVTIEAHEEGPHVVLSVSDDGTGVPESERTAIFERFTRLESDDRGHGSGLGLSIVKGFAEAMGIVVAATAGPGGGACFTLTLAPVDTPLESSAS